MTDRASLALVRSTATGSSSTTAELDVVADVLGPDGLRSRPGVTPPDLVAAASELVRRLLGVDDCWLQPPGPYAESIRTRGLDHVGGGGPVDARTPASGRSATSYEAVAEVVVEGEVHLLVAWSQRGRWWSRPDRAVLVRVADSLAAGLAALRLEQSPSQQARAHFAELKRDLLVTMNHELRTPLTVISSVLELVADMEHDALLAKHLARVGRNVERLLTLADNVNLLAPGLPDALLHDEARTDAQAVAEQVAGTVTADGCEVRVRSTGPVTALVDEGDLRELLERVVGNAVKFTPAGGTVEVSVTREDGEVEIRVSDDGAGIAEAEQHLLGEEFFRSVSDRSDERQGAGLGLAAAMAIAQRWSGRLVVDSAPGEGTRVTARFPAPPERQRAGAVL